MEKLNINYFVSFYEKQKSDEKRDDYFKNNISLSTNYIPYLQKVATIKSIVDATSFSPENKEVYLKNSAMQYILYVMNIIDMYTNLDVKFGDEKVSIITQYDQLKKNGLVDKIIAIVPKSELEEMKALLSMQNTDTHENFGTLTKYIDKKLEKLNGFFSFITENEEVMNKINSIINK